MSIRICYSSAKCVTLSAIEIGECAFGAKPLSCESFGKAFDIIQYLFGARGSANSDDGEGYEAAAARAGGGDLSVGDVGAIELDSQIEQIGG